MKTIISCGGVVFTRTNDGIRYVVIRAHNGDWGFPKGHMEPGEDEVTTALREIREEVGLRPTLLDGFQESIRYPFPGRPDVIKQSVYFLAEFSGQDIIPQPEEVAWAGLLSFGEAMEILSFPETKGLLEQADRFLRERNPSPASL